MRKLRFDVQVENHGSIFLFRLLTDSAQEWADEHVPDGMYWGGALACEPRYARDLAQGMLDDGLSVH